MILAIDTANIPVSVCLAEPDGRLLTEAVFAPQEQPAATLFPVIGRLLDEAGASLADVTRLAVCHGPGSFTGIRIGLAAVAGLRLILPLPVFTVSTLEAYAAAANAPVLVRVPDGAGGLVEQDFAADGSALSSIRPVTDSALPPPEGFLEGGPGWGMPAKPLARHIAVAAARRPDTAAPDALIPLYLRPSYAEVAASLRASDHPG